MSDTIAAIATGIQRSAIGIIRLSGDDAIEIASRAFRPLCGRSLSRCSTHTLILGDLLTPDGRVLDRCLAAISRAPGSYTGENTAELQCHGSPAVLAAALAALFSFGARQALAGEFTKRAFLNGRLDLTQAEAVIDLIDAETEQCALNAAAQLGGAVSRRTDIAYNTLAASAAHFHAIIDYPDDETEPFELDRLREALVSALTGLKPLLDSFGRGRIIKDGVKCAIIGKPNVGKSSLLNALVGYERAIVTPQAGTTRDTIEERIVLGGVLLRLNDTAGLRSTDDRAEAMGVERALLATADARLAIAVFDGSSKLSEEDFRVMETARSAENRIAVVNKSDLPAAVDLTVLNQHFERIITVSALNMTGLEALDAAVSELFSDDTAVDGEVITNARQYDAVSRACACITRALDAVDSGMTFDAILTDAEQAMYALGELSGKTVKEDILSNIFSRFCVGK